MNISISFLFKAILMELSFTETVNLRLTKQFTERIGPVNIPAQWTDSQLHSLSELTATFLHLQYNTAIKSSRTCILYKDFSVNGNLTITHSNTLWYIVIQLLKTVLQHSCSKLMYYFVVFSTSFLEVPL
jgi:hypothetical protein